MDWRHSEFMQGPDILPLHIGKGMDIAALIENYERSCFEARNVAAAAKLYKTMAEEGDTIWLGVSGAVIAGGLGGYVIDLMERGYVDAVCSTGAQVYHDLHFAYGLPVRQGQPRADDNALREDGTTRIYDIHIRERETLLAQDAILLDFGRTCGLTADFSSADLNFALGRYVLRTAPHPERSFVAQAAHLGVPVFWDSLANHSIGMNLAKLYLEGRDLSPNPSLDVLESAALLHAAGSTGFFEFGGGGPKNFIQQMGPTLSQILGVAHEGADRGIQVTTAVERDGGLSGCTFGEAVTWGKYKDATRGLVQVWGEVSVIAPLLAWYVVEACAPRPPKRLLDKKAACVEGLRRAAKLE